MRSFLVVLIAAFVLGGVATTASAQSPTRDAYGGVLGEQVGGSSGGGSGPSGGADEATLVSQGQSSSSLPFTGLDLGLVVLIGAGLVGLGVGLRWTTRRTLV
jgi:hypothetical protein